MSLRAPPDAATSNRIPPRRETRQRRRALEELDKLLAIDDRDAYFAHLKGLTRAFAEKGAPKREPPEEVGEEFVYEPAPRPPAPPRRHAPLPRGAELLAGSRTRRGFLGARRNPAEALRRVRALRETKVNVKSSEEDDGSSSDASDTASQASAFPAEPSPAGRGVDTSPRRKYQPATSPSPSSRLPSASVEWRTSTHNSQAPRDHAQTSQAPPSRARRAVGPAWTRGEIERPAGERDMGSYKTLVYTAEQQTRLGVDDKGAPSPRRSPRVESARFSAADVAEFSATDPTEPPPPLPPFSDSQEALPAPPTFTERPLSPSKRAGLSEGQAAAVHRALRRCVSKTAAVVAAELEADGAVAEAFGERPLNLAVGFLKTLGEDRLDDAAVREIVARSAAAASKAAAPPAAAN